MSKGGHARSGPRPEEDSLRTARRGLSWRELPAEGYACEAPEWPLPESTPRELEVWRRAWRSPQAVAWAHQPWRWYAVALWVRWSVRMEDPAAPAAVATAALRLADQVGMTPAGLRECGWKVVATPGEAPAREDEPEPGGEPAESAGGQPSQRRRSPSKARLTVVRDAAEGA